MALWMAAPLLCLLAMAGPCAGAQPQPPDDELDEVHVEGTRLYQMRAAIVAAEERFYALYNELNPERDFAVNCYREAPLGTRLKRRVCKVAYFEEAQADYAQGLLTGYQAPSPDIIELERSDEYRRHMLKVINSDQRLLRLVREREALEKRYLEERKRRFKGRWILFE